MNIYFSFEDGIKRVPKIQRNEVSLEQLNFIY
jgi:hypothetical protein